MILDPIVVLAGLCYLFLGISLLTLSLWLFESWTHFDVRHEILHVQNKALSDIIRGVMIAQGVIIAAAIFFTGYTPESGTPILQVFLPSLLWSGVFGVLGMIFLQGILSLFFRVRHLEKEILIDQNTALSRIVEGTLVALALIVAISFYSY